MTIKDIQIGKKAKGKGKNKVGKPIENELSKLGLKQKEVEVYITCLERGTCTLQKLSDACSFKRSSVYNYVDTLVKKGLIIETKKGNRRYLAAADPEKLHTLLDTMKWEVENVKEDLPDIIANLTSYLPRLRSMGEDEIHTNVSYYDNEEDVRNIFGEVFEADTIYYFSKLGPDFKKVSDNMEKAKDLIIERGTVLKAIIDDSLAGKSFTESDMYQGLKDVPTFECKRIHTSLQFELTSFNVVLYNNKLTLVIRDKRKEFVILENSKVVHYLKGVYELLWNMSPTI